MARHRTSLPAVVSQMRHRLPDARDVVESLCPRVLPALKRPTCGVRTVAVSASRTSYDVVKEGSVENGGAPKRAALSAVLTRLLAGQKAPCANIVLGTSPTSQMQAVYGSPTAN